MLTTGAPAIQAAKTIRSGQFDGLSAGTYTLLVTLGLFATLMGVQYSIVSMIALNAIGTCFNVATLYLIGRRWLFFLVGLLVLTAAVGYVIAPWALAAFFTTRWAEQIAFIYGLFASFTFVPQILLIHRTRQVEGISLANCVMMVAGIVLWTIVGFLVENRMLVLWNSIITLMLLEILRMRLKYGRASRTDDALASD